MTFGRGMWRWMYGNLVEVRGCTVIQGALLELIGLPLN